MSLRRRRRRARREYLLLHNTCSVWSGCFRICIVFRVVTMISVLHNSFPHDDCRLLSLSPSLTLHMSDGKSVTYRRDTVSAREHDWSCAAAKAPGGHNSCHGRTVTCDRPPALALISNQSAADSLDILLQETTQSSHEVIKAQWRHCCQWSHTLHV